MFFNLVWHYALLELGDRRGHPGGRGGVGIGDKMKATVQEVVDIDFLI